MVFVDIVDLDDLMICSRSWKRGRTPVLSFWGDCLGVSERQHQQTSPGPHNSSNNLQHLRLREINLTQANHSWQLEWWNQGPKLPDPSKHAMS